MDVMALRRAIMTRDGLSLPPEYQRVDYLQRSGNNARIDTGVPGNDVTLAFDFTYMALELLDWLMTVGNYVNETTRCWRFMHHQTQYPRHYLISTPARKANSSTSFAAVSAATGTVVGHKTHVHLSYAAYSFESDDGTTGSGTQAEDTSGDMSTRNIAIGSSHPGAGGSATTKGRFYGEFKIWRGGVLIRNYVPCSRRSDSRAGFYDTVNGTFNPSIGNTEFIAGND